MISTKDRAGFFAAFKTLNPHVVTIPVRSSDSGVAPDQLAEEARQAGLTARDASDPLTGLSQAIEATGSGGRILICGSLYMAGDILADGPPLT